jgi:pimeloyl-ACP methyl ester carboxylesterase
MPYPAGLKATEHPPADGWESYDGPAVVLVHGSLDRGSSFTRTIRRLPEWGIVTYDRRGYQGSRDGGPPADLDRHVDDLLGVVAALPDTGRRTHSRPVTAVGHSLGGDVVVGAALAEPGRFASIGAYEPPMPWLDFHRSGGATARRGQPSAGDPADEVERFFRRMVGDAAWGRLPEAMRAERRADGPALAADLAGVRGAAPFDVTALAVPAVFGRGGLQSGAHHRDTVAWLAEHVPGAQLMEIEGAGHGAHLTHPDAFAGFVRAAVHRAGRGPTEGGGQSRTLNQRAATPA